MLNVLKASYYLPLGPSISGGKMVLDSGEVLEHHGRIVTMVPLGASTRELINLDSITTRPAKFFNLHDCEHVKASGLIFRTPVVSSNVSKVPGVFGPFINIGAKYGDCNIIAGRSTEIVKSYVGNFNYCAHGTWCFSLALAIYGNIFVYVYGNPDYRDSQRKYRGYYQFSVTEVELVGINGYRIRSYDLLQTGTRTSSMGPLAAEASYHSRLLAGLQNATWSSVINNSTQMPGSLDGELPNLHIRPSVVFPSGDRNPDWGALASRAYQSVPFFPSNGIALASDITHLKSEVSSTVNLLTSLVSKGAKPKIIAKVFLTFFYGWRLLFLDVSSITKAITRLRGLSSAYQKCASSSAWSSHDASYVAWYHCYYRRYGKLSSDLDKFVSFFGLELNLSNIWDLIPFSFVVDWFVQFGDFLDRLDSYYQMTQEHQIVCSGRSIKCRRSSPATAAGLTGWQGTLDITFYKREYSGDVTQPHFSLTTPQSFNHYIEGTALIVSRR